MSPFLNTIIPTDSPYCHREVGALDSFAYLIRLDRRIEVLLGENAMTDDKTKRGPADRSRINVNEPYELDYWSKEFDLTPEQLRHLVAKHGTSVETIRQLLGK